MEYTINLPGNYEYQSMSEIIDQLADTNSED